MSDIRSMLADTAERLFGDLSTRETVTQAEAGIWPAALWSTVEEAGFAGAAAPDAGFDLGDLAAVLRQSGAQAAPVPLVETMLATWLLASAGLDAPDGPLSVATEATIDLVRDGDGWTLSGVLPRVPWGSAAKAVALVTEVGGVPHVALVSPADAEVASDTNLAGEPRDTLTFTGLSLRAAVVAASPIDAGLLADRLRLFRLVQMNGALDQILEMAVRYAGERVQFGKPIGKFQAVQQQLAVLAAEVAASSAAVAAAVAAAETGDARFETAASVIRVCDAISTGASIAHQVHGAMGVTREHALHQFTRRLWSWRDEIGDERAHARAIGRAVAKRGGQSDLWAYITAPLLEPYAA